MMEIDFTKPVEAYHEDGRTMPVSSIHPWGNDQWPWCGVADTEHIYMGKYGCSRSVHGDMPGWRIRNRKPEEHFTPASECGPIHPNATPINRELWERVCGLVRELASQREKVAANTIHTVLMNTATVYTTGWVFNEAREIAKLLPVVEDEAGKLMQEFYLSPDYNPKAERPADIVKAAIAFTLKRGRELERGE